MGQFTLVLNTTLHCHCLYSLLLISSRETPAQHRVSPLALSKRHTLAALKYEFMIGGVSSEQPAATYHGEMHRGLMRDNY